MKQIALLILSIFVAVGAHAAKANAPSFKAVLTDGRTVTLTLVGDEHLNYYVTSEGEIVLYANDKYHAASKAEQDSLQAVLTRLAAQSMETMRRGAERDVNAVSHLDVSNATPHLGTPRIPIILVQFTDSVFRYTRDDIDSLLNGKQYQVDDKYRGYGSARQFFVDCSNGKFQPQFDIYGPYTLPNTSKYYGAGSAYNERATTVVREALKLANPDIDFRQYDYNNNSTIDGVCVIYAGWNSNTSGNSDDIWPQSGDSQMGTYDGFDVNRWLVCGELLYGPEFRNDEGQFALTGIGVFVHEFSHMMGLPDFYPTSISNTDYAKLDNQSMEDWDIMDNGENQRLGLYPQPYSAWEQEYLAWADELEVLSEPADVHLIPLMHGGKGLKIMNDNDASGKEFWVLEALPNTKDSGWYRWTRGDGMLITHILFNKINFSGLNHPNNTVGKPGITIIPADGYLPSSYRVKSDITESYGDYLTSSDYFKQLAGDTYPGSQVVTSFNDYKAYTGTVDKPITEIERIMPGHSVKFKFMGGTHVGIEAVKDAKNTDSIEKKAYKTLRNGQLVIINGNNIYTPAGTLLK